MVVGLKELRLMHLESLRFTRNDSVCLLGSKTAVCILSKEDKSGMNRASFQGVIILFFFVFFIYYSLYVRTISQAPGDLMLQSPPNWTQYIKEKRGPTP